MLGASRINGVMLRAEEIPIERLLEFILFRAGFFSGLSRVGFCLGGVSRSAPNSARKVLHPHGSFLTVLSDMSGELDPADQVPAMFALSRDLHGEPPHPAVVAGPLSQFPSKGRRRRVRDYAPELRLWSPLVSLARAARRGTPGIAFRRVLPRLQGARETLDSGRALNSAQSPARGGGAPDLSAVA